MKKSQKTNNLPSLTAWLILLLLALQSPLLDAASATWKPTPLDGGWNNNANWTPGSAPNGSSDTATFDFSNLTSVFLSANTQVNGIVFDPGASAFTITASPTFTLTISGIGITNNSGTSQNFVAAGSPDFFGVGGQVQFSGAASAGSSTFTITGGSNTFAGGGLVQFSGSATAGSGAFTTSGGTNNGSGGSTRFIGTSTAGTGTFTTNAGGQTQFSASATAGSASFINNGAPPTFGAGVAGITQFSGSSTAGNGTFINNTSTAGAIFGLASGGQTQFVETATAGSGTFTNNGGTLSNTGGGKTSFAGSSTANNATLTSNAATVSGASGGTTSFTDTSTAGSATLINNGGTVSGALIGGTTAFALTSTAASSTLIANGGTGGGDGGTIQFLQDSTGGTARVEVFGNGDLDISLHNAPGVAIGSLEGTGVASLGARNLTIGSNNLSTTFSGRIQDGAFGGTGGSLSKIGTGTLSLTNSNTYTGGTLINAGTLLAGADGALGTGNVSLAASSVTLTLQNGATNNYIADNANLSIVSGSTINLNFNGNPDAVSALFVDGIAQAPGLYGSAASGAPNQLSELFGTGELLVTAIPEPSTWAMIGIGGFLLCACQRYRRSPGVQAILSSDILKSRKRRTYNSYRTIFTMKRQLLPLLLAAVIGLAAILITASARAQLYVGDQSSNTVGTYNASTGAAINPNFVTGLRAPQSILLSGSSLLVTNFSTNTVGQYNASSGAATNASFVATGLNGPDSLAISGSNLYVASIGGTVGLYSAITGAAVNASFISGLNNPQGIALFGGNLFITLGGNTVAEYNAVTGALINAAFITGLNNPAGLAIMGSNLFVANFGSGTNGTVGEYSAITGAAINISFINSGLNAPDNLAVSGNNLYVTNFGSGTVGEYNATTGAAINASLITGFNQPIGIAVVPEPATWALLGLGAILLCACQRYRRSTGESLWAPANIPGHCRQAAGSS
ncbi:MAG: beta strand repeat-containing protein [Chthoniobacterales bacterium]